jgi:hypothetical protein
MTNLEHLAHGATRTSFSKKEDELKKARVALALPALA